MRSYADGSERPPRVAFAVPRRVGSAADRNRIRRRLRAAVARCQADLRPGCAYLFDADRTVLTMSFDAIMESMAQLLRGAVESGR